VVETHQNKGVGRWLLGQIADEARQNGDKSLVLEVIEQNPRAVHLYQECGFTIVRRLKGYNGTNLSGEPADLTPIDPVEAARRISSWQSADLPWQCAGETLVTIGAPHAAYYMDGCYAMCSNPDAENITILGLGVPPEQQRKGRATRLVSALIAAHPEKIWRVAPNCPEEYGDIFIRNGFTVDKLNQFQMALSVK
jgi:ribosomal protein S18 acetylase RimI-like enzyme